MSDRWSKEKAWDWYRNQPWIRGFNYVPSDCVNRFEEWQELDFDEKLATTDREFELAASVGFNAVRVILEYEVWRQQRTGFLERFDRFLDVAAKHQIKPMVVFGNDCNVPKSKFVPPVLGPQKVEWGYAYGSRVSPLMSFDEVGWNPMDEPETAELFTEMVAEVIGRHAKDPRVHIWDLWNEPGNSKRESKSLPYIERFFEVARAADPIQPLVSGPWRVRDDGSMMEIEEAVLELSDIVGYHDYGRFNHSIRVLERLKREGRPMVNKEWMNRMGNNGYHTHLPLFFLERVGIYHWGLVAGKRQDHEPHESMWQREEAGGAPDLDFTKWKHDLFRRSHRPYDPREMDLIEEYFTLSDEVFAAGNW